MAEGKLQAVTSMSTRQKVTIAVFVVVVLVVLWEVIGLFGGGTPSAPRTQTTTTTTTEHMTATGPGGAMGGGPISPMQQQPQSAQLIKQEPMTQREMELMKLQQETQAKYLSAINELQLLKVSKDIAETNQAIAKAKLATIAAEKNIVTLLSPPVPQVTPAGYAASLVNQGSGAVASAPAQPPAQTPPPSQVTTTTTTTQPAASYTVVSVSQLQYRWNAVLGYQGNLYNVSVGDVLPADGSKVISIDKSGVWLEKNNAKKKISLIPII